MFRFAEIRTPRNYPTGVQSKYPSWATIYATTCSRFFIFDFRSLRKYFDAANDLTIIKRQQKRAKCTVSKQ